MYRFTDQIDDPVRILRLKPTFIYGPTMMVRTQHVNRAYSPRTSSITLKSDNPSL